MRSLHFVVPDSVDDRSRPSGGNTYDVRVIDELKHLGWAVHVHTVPGRWPCPDDRARATLALTLARVPRGAVVVIDGLVASGTPEVVVPEADRLVVVVLVHLPLGAIPDRPRALPDRPGDRPVHEAEREVLAGAAAVVATSDWTRSLLLDRYALDPDLVHVAEPGVDCAPVAHGTPAGTELLCVAAVVPDKGHAQLVSALAQLRELDWRCTCAGAVDLDPDFAASLVHQVECAGIRHRVRFVGPLAGTELDHRYAVSDLLVVPSRIETYGLVVTEALARGIPVVANAVGGVPAAMGRAPDGTRPGLLVPADDVGALGAALRSWLVDGHLRDRLRRSARERRPILAPYATTARAISEVLAELVA